MTQFLFGFLLYLTTLVVGWSGYEHSYTLTPQHKEIHAISAQGKGTQHDMLMLHGMGSQSADLYPLMQTLRPYVKTITAVDLPAHGLTQIEIGKQPLAGIQNTFFEGLHRLIQKKKSPVILWGNSLGGWNALNYASRYPQDVKALILVSPAGAKENAVQSAHLSKVFLEYSQHAPHKMVPLLFNHAPADAHLIGSSLQARFSTPQLRSLMAKLQPQDTVIPAERIRNLKMPTLLIWGKNDRIFPEEVTYFKQSLPKTATVIEPESFTHSPYIEGNMAQELADIMLEWIQRPASVS